MTNYLHIKKWRENNALKIKAHRVVYTNLRNNKIKRMPCSVCGFVIAEAHHEDYSKPLEIIWLCKKHHAEKGNEKRPKKKWTKEYTAEYGRKYRRKRIEIRKKQREETLNGRIT